MSKTILILVANPKNTSPLRLDQEVREISNGLERAQKRDEFTLKQKLAARPVDVRRAMLDYKPNIVHFCGHGSGEEGIAFEDENGEAKLVSTDAIAGLFELFADRVECVVLNACYSEAQASAIATHIPYVVGMRSTIGDVTAIEFAVAFYDALGAGESVEFAYRLACNAIQWAGLPEDVTPVLKTRQHPKPPVSVKLPWNQPIADKEMRELVEGVSSDIRKSAEEALLMFELAYDKDVLRHLDEPGLLAHFASKTEAGLSLFRSSENIELIRYLNEIAMRSDQHASIAKLRSLLPDALPIVINEFLLLQNCEHIWWGWRIQLELADIMMPYAEDIVIRAFATVLLEKSLDAEHSSLATGLIQRARKLITNSAEFDSWLKQVAGFTYGEFLQAYRDAHRRSVSENSTGRPTRACT